MKDKFFLYESIIKSTEFYQRLLDAHSKVKMFNFIDKILLYEYDQNNVLIHTYFIHFKRLPFFKFIVTIKQDGKNYSQETHYINYQSIDRNKVKKKSFIKK